jgi:hypothetical protein
LASVPVTKGVTLALEVSRDVGALAERMLADAYELVLGGWCQGSSAQDEMGRAIEPSSAFARSWSVSGALERVWRRGGEHPDTALDAFERAHLALAGAARDVPQKWNDAPGRTRAEALEMLAEARRLVRDGSEPAPALVDDLLEDLGRYDAIPGFLFESSR